MAVFVKMESIPMRVHVQRIQVVQNVKNVSDLSHQSSYLNMTTMNACTRKLTGLR